MSLKAGYRGIKNSLAVGMSSFVQKFKNALVIKSIGSGLDFSEAGELSAAIKSIGDGLTLSQAGALSADIKSIGSGLTLSEAGELSANAQSMVYSTTEFDTGEKWIDGNSIYGIVFQSASIGANSWGAAVDTGVVIDKLIDFFTISADASGSYLGRLIYASLTAGTTTSIKFASPISGIASADVVVFYTKTSSRKKGGSK